MRRRAVGWAAFAGAAAGGTALGWMAERRAARGARPGLGPEAAELAHPVRGRPLTVPSFDGTPLAVEVLGPDDAPTLVFAHGYGLSQHLWHHQRRDLPPHLRVVCYDQRGHAGSGRALSGDYSIEALGRDLEAVLAAAVPAGRRAVVVGHSMGGMSVLAYAEAHPGGHAEAVHERIAGAVLVNTAAGDLVRRSAFSLGVAAASSLHQAIGGRLRGRDATAPVDRTSDLSFFLTRAIALNPDASPAHVEFLERMLVDVPNAVKAAFGTTLSSIDLRTAVARLSVPVLVVAGEQDRLTPVSQSEALVDGVRRAGCRAELVVLPGVGHHAPLEAAAELNAHLRAFAARVGA